MEHRGAAVTKMNGVVMNDGQLDREIVFVKSSCPERPMGSHCERFKLLIPPPG